MYVELVELQNEKKKKNCISNKDYNMILEKFPSIPSFHSYLVNLKSDFVFHYSFYYQKNYWTSNLI